MAGKYPSEELSVLVVEDNTGDFLLMEDYLTDEFRSVAIDRAISFAQTVHKLQDKPGYNLILLDLSLPDGEGQTLVEQVLFFAKQIPVVVLTGYGNREFGVQTIGLGVSDYLMKDELTPKLLHKSIIYTLERAHLNNKIAESEEAYRSLFDLSPLPKFVYDRDTFKILNANVAAVNTYGYSLNDFLEMDVNDLVPKNGTLSQLNIFTYPEFASENIKRHITKTGQLIYLSTHSSEFIYHGQPAVMLIVSDITENLKSRQAIYKAKIRLETAQEIGKIGYWDFNLKTGELFWTDEIYRILGQDKDTFNVSFQNFLSLVHPDDREAVIEDRTDAIAGTGAHNIEHRIIRPDGSIRYVYQKGSLVKNGDGESVLFEGILQDITERKEEEEQLRLMESVITNSQDAVIITNALPIEPPGPQIIYTNQAFTDMTGYTREEVLGKSPRFLQGPESDRQYLNEIKTRLQNWESFDAEIVNYRKNGEPFWVHLSISPLADSSGHFTHWISIQRDVTDRHNYVRAIEEQNSRLREIAWIQSHLVRAPLARIMGLVSLLETETEESARNELQAYLKISADELDEVLGQIVRKSEKLA